MKENGELKKTLEELKPKEEWIMINILNLIQ